jgi:hypothetical protein
VLEILEKKRTLINSYFSGRTDKQSTAGMKGRKARNRTPAAQAECTDMMNA